MRSQIFQKGSRVICCGVISRKDFSIIHYNTTITCRPAYCSAMTRSTVSYYWLKYTYMLSAPFYTYQYGTLERIFVQRYVTAPFFLGAGPLYSRETASRNFRGFYPPFSVYANEFGYVCDDRYEIGGTFVEGMLKQRWCRCGPQFTNCFSNSRQSARRACNRQFVIAYMPTILYLLFQQLSVSQLSSKRERARCM